MDYHLTHFTSFNDTSQAETIQIATNGLFVTLSLFISVLGAFTTFTFMHELRYTRSYLARFMYITLASISLGSISIWSMHFIGTVCFSFAHLKDGTKTPLNVTYDIGVTIASAIVATVMCFIGFMITTVQLFLPKIRDLLDYISIKQPEKDITNIPKSRVLEEWVPTKRGLIGSIFGNEYKPHFIQILAGGFFMASGVVVTHYLGMYATNVHGTHKNYSAGVIAASIIMAYLVSCVAIWLSFNLENEYQQVFSAVVAAICVGSTHYTGTFSASYQVANTAASHKKKMDNTDLTLIITLAASLTCFLMLMISSIANRKRMFIIAKSSKELEEEKKKVEESVNKLNTLVKKVVLEEHQTRRVMDLVSDGVCIINEEGQILKANSAFEKLSGLTKLSQVTNITQSLPVSVEELFYQNNGRLNVSLTRFTGLVDLQITTTIEEFAEEGVRFCILIVTELGEGKDFSSLPTYVPEKASDLDVELKDEEFVRKFRAFCEAEMCAENLNFILKVAEYKKCSDMLRRVEIQEEIMQQFIRLGSPQQLNLPETILLPATQMIAIGHGQPDLFNLLEVKVKEILIDSFFRYNQMSKTEKICSQVTQSSALN